MLYTGFGYYSNRYCGRPRCFFSRSDTARCGGPKSEARGTGDDKIKLRIRLKVLGETYGRVNLRDEGCQPRVDEASL